MVSNKRNPHGKLEQAAHENNITKYASVPLIVPKGGVVFIMVFYFMDLGKTIVLIDQDAH